MKDALNTGTERSRNGAYVFLLFVAGDEPNSRQARRNLEALCAEELGARFRTEIVDVLENIEAAVKHGVLLTPTLLSLKPGPEARIIGNLSDRERLRAALRIDASASG